MGGEIKVSASSHNAKTKKTSVKPTGARGTKRKGDEAKPDKSDTKKQKTDEEVELENYEAALVASGKVHLVPETQPTRGTKVRSTYINSMGTVCTGCDCETPMNDDEIETATKAIYSAVGRGAKVSKAGLGKDGSRVPLQGSLPTVKDKWKKEIVSIVGKRSYKKERELQFCRHLSTLLYHIHNRPPTEVQCLFVPERKKIYWTANTYNQVALIVGKLEEYECDDVSGGTENHTTTLQEIVNKVGGKLTSDDDRVARHLSKLVGGRYRKMLQVQVVAVPHRAFSKAETHAEINLVELVLNRNETSDTVAYVAGIKRPCVACFNRLSRLAEELSESRDVTLYHKEHSGLLWATAAALNGMTVEDGENIEDFVEAVFETGFKQLYASPNPSSGLEDAFVYGEDTDSDSDGDDPVDDDSDHDTDSDSGDDDPVDDDGDHDMVKKKSTRQPKMKYQKSKKPRSPRATIGGARKK